MEEQEIAEILQPSEAAERMEEQEIAEILQPSFPHGRVKKIMKLDKDINKVNSEAMLLISLSTDLFLQFLSEKSSEITIEKKRKTITVEHLRNAVKRHQPTSDFLLDSLPLPAAPTDVPSNAKSNSADSVAAADKPLPFGTRRIDDMFRKSAQAAAPTE